MKNQSKLFLFANQKGGVGKTTIALNVAVDLANLNLKVCLVNLERFSLLSELKNTEFLTVKTIEPKSLISFYNSLNELKSLYDYILLDLAGVELDSPVGSQFFKVSDHVFIPVKPSKLDAKVTFNYCNALKKSGIKNATIILNEFRKNEILSRNIYNNKDKLPFFVAPVKIPRSQKLVSCSSELRSVHEVYPTSNEAIEFKKLITFIKRL